MLAPDSHSAGHAAGGVGGDTAHRESSFDTTPNFNPRSSSDMIPMKRNGDDWIAPVGDRNWLPAIPVWGWLSMNSTRDCNAPSRTIVSAFSRSTYSGELSESSAGRIKRLLPPQNPR